MYLIISMQLVLESVDRARTRAKEPCPMAGRGQATNCNCIVCLSISVLSISLLLIIFMVLLLLLLPIRATVTNYSLQGLSSSIGEFWIDRATTIRSELGGLHWAKPLITLLLMFNNEICRLLLSFYIYISLYIYNICRISRVKPMEKFRNVIDF